MKPKTSLYQAIKFALVSASCRVIASIVIVAGAMVIAVTVAGGGVGRVGGGVGAQVLAMLIDGSNRGVVASLSGAESNGSNELIR